MTAKTLISAAVAAGALFAVPASAQTVGSDAAACNTNQGPAIRVNVSGLKDRTGRLKLELYPANAQDWLAHGKDLRAAGKTFRRVWGDMPQSGPVAMCIRVPHPGRYGLFFTHDRDHENKFNFWKDGAGVTSNHKLGRSKPKISDSTIDVGTGIAVANIRVQYLHGLSGFGPE